MTRITERHNRLASGSGKVRQKTETHPELHRIKQAAYRNDRACVKDP